MIAETIRDVLRKQPFSPFRVVMSSGQGYEVRHPEMAMLTRNDILIGMGIVDDGVAEHFKICSLLHVTAVEPLSATANNPPAN